MKNKIILIKTISWEVFHFLVLAGIIYIFTGEWEYAGFGALFYIGVEALGYYVHERVWAWIKEKSWI
jgi:uncharacterized membrane protein